MIIIIVKIIIFVIIKMIGASSYNDDYGDFDKQSFIIIIFGKIIESILSLVRLRDDVIYMDSQLLLLSLLQLFLLSL